MKERPIQFGVPMVVAERADRKTETRRTRGLKTVNADPKHWALEEPTNGTPDGQFSFWNTQTATMLTVKSPYGIAGDRLWVKEPLYFDWDAKAWRYKADNAKLLDVVSAELEHPRPDRWPLGICNGTFMPRYASRRMLEVVNIRPERLQDITNEAAIAEGIFFDKIGYTAGYIGKNGVNQEWSGLATIAFANLWRAINGPDSWRANPWVWVVQFKRISP